MTDKGFVSAFSRALEQLEASGFDYMVVGSVAAMIYGEPRLTRDMDIVLAIPATAIRRLEAVFPPEEYYLPPIEILGQEVIARGQFNVIQSASSLKIDLVIRKEDPHAKEEFSRRRRVEILPGLLVWIASPEDIIVRKLLYWREGGSTKHITDAKGILAHTEVDQAYIERWARSMGTEAGWQEVLG